MTAPGFRPEYHDQSRATRGGRVASVRAPTRQGPTHLVVLRLVTGAAREKPVPSLWRGAEIDSGLISLVREGRARDPSRERPIPHGFPSGGPHLSSHLRGGGTALPAPALRGGPRASAQIQPLPRKIRPRFHSDASPVATNCWEYWLGSSTRGRNYPSYRTLPSRIRRGWSCGRGQP